jgi:hypothetical protein
MRILITLLVVATILAVLWLFKRFTKNGTIPLPVAWRSFVMWFSGALVVLPDYFLAVLGWLAQQWEPLQGYFGDLFSSPSLARFVQLLGAGFFLLRAKGQGFPKFPAVPATPPSEER